MTSPSLQITHIRQLLPSHTYFIVCIIQFFSYHVCVLPPFSQFKSPNQTLCHVTLLHFPFYDGFEKIKVVLLNFSVHLLCFSFLQFLLTLSFKGQEVVLVQEGYPRQGFEVGVLHALKKDGHILVGVSDTGSSSSSLLAAIKSFGCSLLM